MACESLQWRACVCSASCTRAHRRNANRSSYHLRACGPLAPPYIRLSTRRLGRPRGRFAAFRDVRLTATAARSGCKARTHALPQERRQARMPRLCTLSILSVNGAAWLGARACAIPRARRVDSGTKGVLCPDGGAREVSQGGNSVSASSPSAPTRPLAVNACAARTPADAHGHAGHGVDGARVALASGPCSHQSAPARDSSSMAILCGRRAQL